MANTEKIILYAIGGVAVLYGIKQISGGVSSAIESVGQGYGGGAYNFLSGIGNLGQLGNIGNAFEGLGGGIGSGISGIGQGAGNALSLVGGGVYEIGKGSGYAISGGNLQDLLQTLLTLGKSEASTYQADSPTLTYQTPQQFTQTTVSTSEANKNIIEILTSPPKTSVLNNVQSIQKTPPSSSSSSLGSYITGAVTAQTPSKQSPVSVAGIGSSLATPAKEVQKIVTAPYTIFKQTTSALSSAVSKLFRW